MKIISVKIVFESEEHTEESGELGNSVPRSRLITANFRDGEWSIDGPIYSRILLALHEVWQRLRQEVKNG